MSDEVEVKKWYTSKTLWANVVGIALVAAKFFGLIGEADIPPEYAVGGMLSFVIGIILRLITKKQITV